MKKYILIILSIFICFLACDKEEANRPYARIRTLGVQDISRSGVTISGEIYNSKNLSIEDHGFVYNLQSSSLPDGTKANTNLEEYFEKESLGRKNGDGFFESTLTRNLIKNATYLAKAYVVSNGITTYDEAIEFESQGGIAPVISKIVPDTAYYGDTINVIGNNFSIQTRYNKIFFNELEAKIVQSSDTLIKTIVPERDWQWKSKSKIKIELGDSEIQSLPDFYLRSPRIDSASTKTVVSGMTVKIYGSNFNDLYGLCIDGKFANYYDYNNLSDSLITVQIPSNISIGKIPIKYSHLSETIIIPDFFESTKPIIESVSPLMVWKDTTLKIRGPFVKYISGFYNYGTPNVINDSLVHIKINYPPNANKIYGYYNGEEICAKDSIGWLPPIVKAVDPSVAYSGDKIIVSGERFFEGLLIVFGDNLIRADYINENTIEFIVPPINSGQHNIEFQYSQQKFDVQESIYFEVPAISITNISPSIAKRGDTIEISLENANPNEYFSVYIDGNWADVVEVNESSIRAKIGNNILLSDYPSVKVNNGGRIGILEMGFQAIEPWEQIMEIEDFHVQYSSIAHPNNIPVMLTRKYYYGDYVLLQYNETFNNWDKIATYDLTGTYPYVMSKDDMMYFVSHDEDSEARKIIKIESYSTSKMEWDEEGSFFYEGEPNSLITFLKEEKIYVGDKSVMKSFDLKKKTWEDKTIVPTDEYRPNNIISFAINNRSYILFSNIDKTNDESNSEFWEYDSDNDSWKYIPGCPFYVNYYSTFCSDNQMAYCTINQYDSSKKELWVFDTNNSTWENYLPPAERCNSTLSFTHNGFLYYGYSDGYGNGLDMSRTNINDLIKLEE
ncbi:IPT/TIG domain-containing protein [Labilibaculum sp. DW002]|uniref:IPT/TIG domain-containing protein n=1 Tax=Paralabilibaculum antarcticum TaxID=2912572 RepID=A0ABT5VSX8_9BACT|nr:IPT/TIG domain-containing protein [Labilibaculum sp. DW002]MDE5418508.1 IPT/TIG domain-containing protein [Labilibaculum sp. DW002]